MCGINSAVECQPSKLNVTGSNPVFRSELLRVLLLECSSAVEQTAVNRFVAGSIPATPVINTQRNMKILWKTYELDVSPAIKR